MLKLEHEEIHIVPLEDDMQTHSLGFAKITKKNECI